MPGLERCELHRARPSPPMRSVDEDSQRRNITLADWGSGTFGKNVSIWGGRYLDVRSPAVRQVQRRRLGWMAGIGCDGVDPGKPAWGRAGLGWAGGGHGGLNHKQAARCVSYCICGDDKPRPPCTLGRGSAARALRPPNAYWAATARAAPGRGTCPLQWMLPWLQPHARAFSLHCSLPLPPNVGPLQTTPTSTGPTPASPFPGTT